MLLLPVLLLAPSSILLAHAANVSLVYPAPRAANKYRAIEEGSCSRAVFDNSSAPWRIPFPLDANASVVIHADRAVEDFSAEFAFGENPNAFGSSRSITRYPNGTEKDFFGGLYFSQSVSEGQHCYTVNTNTLATSRPLYGNLTDGDIGSIYVAYSVNGTWEYVCSDIVLVANYSLPSNSSCDVVNSARVTASPLDSVQLVTAGLLSIGIAALAL